jgi:hypothetical protein
MSDKYRESAMLLVLRRSSGRFVSIRAPHSLKHGTIVLHSRQILQLGEIVQINRQSDAFKEQIPAFGWNFESVPEICILVNAK